MFKIDNPLNNYKNISHAFFLALAITIAEPSTVLPLIIHHFSQSVVIVGLFVSLLRVGAIVIQLYAAFHAQEYRKVLPYLIRVFFFRFLSWFSIGASIYFIGDNNKTLTLFFIGTGLFFFSFTAGFGAIYFKELQAKIFSKNYRGTAMANRQVAGSIASILSGVVAGYVLDHFQPPLSYAYLFMLSSLLMGVGFFIFGTVEEPPKEKTLKKEKSFKLFVKNSFAILKSDKRLQLQIITIFLSFSYLLSMPFVILNANSTFKLSGWMLGGFITVQMVGSIIGSSFLWRKIKDYEKMLSLSISFMIVAFLVAFFASNLYAYGLVFLLFGFALDGFSNSNMNLVIEIAPEEKRPIYTALQTNLTSFGYLFPILGGVILKFGANYHLVYIITITLLFIALWFSRRLTGR